MVWKKALVKVHKETESRVGSEIIQAVSWETGFDPDEALSDELGGCPLDRRRRFWRNRRGVAKVRFSSRRGSAGGGQSHGPVVDHPDLGADLLPRGSALGVNPVHLGILIDVNMEVGLCHPPVGLNLYVASGISKLGITELTQAVSPWLLTMLVFLVIVTYWPWLTLVVSRAMNVM